MDKYFEYTIKQRKIIEDQYDSQFKDYRNNDKEERTKYINKKLNKLQIHEKLQKLNLNDVMMDFDVKSLYPSAMWDENSVFLNWKLESGFALKPHKKKNCGDAFINQTFNQDGNESAILKMKYYNPPDLIFEHLPIKEKVKNRKNNRMRNGFIIDTLTSVDIQESVKTGSKVIQFYEGVIRRENFKITPFRKVIEKLLASRQKYKDEHNDLIERLVKIIMSSLYGAQIGRDIIESYCCKSEHWMQTEYDENVLDYWRLPNGNYFVKMKKDEGLDDNDYDLKNTVPAQLGSFILSISQRNMNKFIREMNGFHNNNKYYTDADNLYIEKKF